ncbi:hypothetical protein MTR_5g098005 [Medicago truncatula]|uniref:Uncharacterized protein n=1 Tax=Medicago truncatula TaxID=3880 RepID=A0A072UH94_MEDTR|nr:hypothetical protein MTR_5g098005 [Medicago truncatula]
MERISLKRIHSPQEITTIHRDFSKAALCSFYKITMDHRDFGIFGFTPNTHLAYDDLLILTKSTHR